MIKKIIFFLFIVSTFLFADKDLIKRQEDILIEIKKDIKVNNYTLEEPFIMVNPFEISPQTALLIFNTEKKSKIEVFLKDNQTKEEIKIYSSNDYLNNHRIELVGLFTGKNELIIRSKARFDKMKERGLTIRTERAPKQVKVETIVLEKEASKDFLLLIPSGPDQNQYLSAYDNQGRLRWYISKKGVSATGSFNRLANGHYMVLSGKVNRPPYYIASAYEIDLMGRIYREIDFKGNGHHEILELPNGNLLVPVNLNGSKTDEDSLVEYDKDGKVVRVIDFKDILNMHGAQAQSFYKEKHFRNIEERAKHDWMHINAINYNPKTDELLVSSRHLNAVINIDYTTQKINWILADPQNEWLTDEHKTKLLKPKNKDFKYQYGQHGVKFLANGNILVYDNGNFSDLYNRGILDSMKTYDPSKNITRGLELKISNGKVETVWEHKLEGEYTPFIGDINKLRDNHYIVNYGGILLIDAKPTHDILECIYGNGENNLGYGRIIELKEGKVVHEVKTYGEKDNTVYRAKKIKILN